MKPRFAKQYRDEDLELVRASCLYVATRLGDLLNDLVVAGGLVPSLLIPRDSLAAGVDPHVGTTDLDLGMQLAVLDEKRYADIAQRLRDAGFEPDKNALGNQTRQRWIDPSAPGITMDFLIPPSRPEDQGGTIQNLEADFAALITPGLDLAFLDKEMVSLTGRTSHGADATREIQVCGPGAYVVLKALAFAGRGQEKDAYDLYFVVANFGSGIDAVSVRLRALLSSPHAERARRILKSDFTGHCSLGPRGVAQFLHGGPDAEVQADVAGSISMLLSRL